MPAGLEPSTTVGWADKDSTGQDGEAWTRQSPSGSRKSEVGGHADANPNQPFDQEKHEASGHEAAEQ